MKGSYLLQPGIKDSDLLGEMFNHGLIISWSRGKGGWKLVSQLDIPWERKTKTHNGGIYARPRWRYDIRLDIRELVEVCKRLRDEGKRIRGEQLSG